MDLKLNKQPDCTGMLRYDLIFYLVFALLFSTYSYASSNSPHANHVASPQFDEASALAFSQTAIGKKISDNYSLTRSDGKRIEFSKYLGKPLVVSFIYTSCYHICPTTTQHLGDVIKKASQVLGDKSFSVVTIGFDVFNDTPEAMRMFAAQQRIDVSQWDFLSADAITIEQLSKDLGFIFFPSAKGYDHVVQATIVDKNGIVYRQVYDMNFKTPLLVEPLKALVYGTTETTPLLTHIGNKIRLFCTIYDPSNDRYIIDYSMFIGIFIGLTTMAMVIYFVMKEWKKSGGRA